MIKLLIKYVITISFSIGILTLLVYIFLKPKFSVHADGTTISVLKNTFYIPTTSPTKIYKFDPNPPELSNILKSNVKDYPATFGIYIKNISTGQEASLNADETFNAASLYKLAVMYTIYQKAADGMLDITTPEIQNNLNAMITASSNDAAYFLINNYTSWDEITTNMHNLGLVNTSLNQDPVITTPRDMGKLLELIANGQAVNLDASVSMLELMLAQTINDRIPVHLPPNALIAHKTGELDDARHDVAVIISPENNFILVLMSKGSEDPEQAKPIMSKISSEVYDFFAKQWANPPEIL